MLTQSFLDFISKKNLGIVDENQPLESQNIKWDDLVTELAKELKLDIFKPDPLFLASASSILSSDLFEKISLDRWQENFSFVIHNLDDEISICVVDPFNIEWVNLVRFLTNKEVKISLISFPDLLLVYRSLDTNYKFAPDDSSDGSQLTVLKRDRNSEAISVKFLDQLILDATLKGATDIHLIPGENTTDVKFRLNGELVERIKIPNKLSRNICYRLKSLANLDVANSIIPQDGSLRYDDGFKIHELRLSFIPSDYGESLVIRILGAQASNINLDSLGLSESEIKVVKSALLKSSGLIVVSGPTGAGKTTTLYSLIKFLNDGKRKIVTIEDPVEYRLEGISQFQVNEKQGLTFAKFLKSSLRHDPDVILVGELRDSETARICIHAAQTGHLVLTTLHANSAIGVITRLLNLEVSRIDLSSVLSIVIYQRLIKTKLGERKPIFEVLKIDKDLSQLISKGATELEIEESARLKGYTNLYTKVSNLYYSDEISEEEFRKFELDNYRSGSKQKPLILLVEDNEDTALIFKKLLEDRYFDVEIAKDGLDALEKLSSIRPDLIVSDIMMPRMSGIELVKKIRTQLGLTKIPVVMLTAVDTDENELKSFELGASDFVPKIEDPQIIIARLERFLRQN